MQELTNDLVITATTEDGFLSLVAGITTELVRDTQRRHGLAPTTAAALGRLATGTTLLGGSLKGSERLSLQIVGNGPIGSVVAEVALNSPHEIGTRAFARHPEVDLPLNALGKFDVGSAIGTGRLQVTKSYEIGQPYVGIVELRTGEIGDDLAGYLLHSQQIPSVVALGVSADRDGISAAGGIIAQVMPNADESVFSHLEEQAAKMTSVTSLIRDGAAPRDIMNALTGGLPLRSFGSYSVSFTCRCTREKVETALLGLGRDELTKMAHEEEKTEAICEFCRHAYYLNSQEVLDLAGRLHRRG